MNVVGDGVVHALELREHLLGILGSLPMFVWVGLLAKRLARESPRPALEWRSGANMTASIESTTGSQTIGNNSLYTNDATGSVTTATAAVASIAETVARPLTAR